MAARRKKAARKAAPKKAPTRKRTSRKAGSSAGVGGTNKGSERKSKGGRPAYEPGPHDRQRVSIAMSCGMTVEQARKLIINPQTDEPVSKNIFTRVYKREIDSGKEEWHLNLVRSLKQRAMDPKNPGGTTAAIFLLKTRYGYVQTDRQEMVDSKHGVLRVPESDATWHTLEGDDESEEVES